MRKPVLRTIGMQEPLDNKPVRMCPEEVHVRVRPVMELQEPIKPQVIGSVPMKAVLVLQGPPVKAVLVPPEEPVGRFNVQCGPLVDGRAECKVTKEE